MPPSPLTRLRRICMSLPGVREVEAWGEPTWRVKTIFAMHASGDTHHASARDGVWIKSDATNQQLMVRAHPKRYFVPPYVGPFGWVGVYLDARTDWDLLRELLTDAWRMSAPKKVVAQFDAKRRR